MDHNKKAILGKARSSFEAARVGGETGKFSGRPSRSGEGDTREFGRTKSEVSDLQDAPRLGMRTCQTRTPLQPSLPILDNLWLGGHLFFMLGRTAF